MSQSPPADWYIDPQNPAQLRYWDGTAWTEHRSPRTPADTKDASPEERAAPTDESVVSAHPGAGVQVTDTSSTEASTADTNMRVSATPQQYWLGGSRGWPSVDVVGEAYREDQLVAALGYRPKLDEELEVRAVAMLIPEPDNPHDRNAISVRIEGNVVGYLAKEDAKRFKPFIDRVVASGHIPTTNASIWAVQRRTYEGNLRLNSNVRLSLSEPHLLLPVNDAPKTPYSIVPWGSGLQVTGEEQHFDVLKPFVGSHDRQLLIVTLHKGVEAKPRGDREYVEVRVDGKRVGEMSTATSKHFFPIIDHLSDQGLTTAAWAHLKGSSLTAELVLQAVKASEVDDAWLNGDPETLPQLVPRASNYYVPPAYQASRTAGRTAPRIIPSKQAAKNKAKGGDPMGAALRPAAMSAKGGCAVILLGAAATIAIAIPVLNHLV